MMLIIYTFFLKSSNHWIQFQSYLHSCHVNMSFAIETDQNNNMAFVPILFMEKVNLSKKVLSKKK